MRVLITGGTGFIGSHLAEALTASGAEVFALVRDPAKLRFLQGVRATLLRGDLAAVPALPPRLDRVFHLAGLTKTLKTAAYYTANRLGTASFLDALTRQGQKPVVVVLSSMAAAGPSADPPGRKEEDPPAPVSPYGKSKRGGEEEALARKERLPIVILRVGAVYGPRDADFLDLFRFVQRGILPSFGRRPRLLSVCYVKDLVRAMLAASETPTLSGEIFHVGNIQPSSFEEIGRTAARVLGVRVRRIVLPMPLIGAAAAASEGWSRLAKKATIINRHKFNELRQAGWLADVEKARQKLGFEAVYSLEAGLAETLAWYKNRGWL